MLDEAQAMLDNTQAEGGEATVQARLGPIRAASDGGMIEFKPTAPRDQAILDHWQSKGVAVASRAEVPAAGTADLAQGIPRVDVTPMSAAVMEGREKSPGAAPGTLASPLFQEGARSPYSSGESKGAGEEKGAEEKDLPLAEEDKEGESASGL